MGPLGRGREGNSVKSQILPFFSLPQNTEIARNYESGPGVIPAARIYLHPSYSRPPSFPRQGKSIRLDVGRNDLVEDVRQQICDTKDIPPHQQRLIFGTMCEGKQLEDGYTLLDYSISSHADLRQDAGWQNHYHLY